MDFTEKIFESFFCEIIPYHKAGVAKQIAPPLNSLNKVNAIEITWTFYSMKLNLLNKNCKQ